MKKILSFLLFFIIFFHCFGQLDREHWFAPMVDRVINGNDNQTLYLSTNRTTPFPVTIYNNNVIIATATISKGNPQKVVIPRNLIIATLQTDIFSTITKGLYVKGDFPFFANLRFSITNHGEIITSKGLAAIGTDFRAVMAPITVNNSILNFMTSVLATEDNTQVTVSGYQSGVMFSNGANGITSPNITFTLNKGQSYIIDGNGFNTSNFTSFIGAKITSTKPVSVTNGNFNGQYSGNIPTSSDILMDQSVPIQKLGSEFALVKGNGPIGTNMEGAIIVATVDNTQIFVNSEIPPIATINAGQFFVIPDSKYINQTNGHYNLYIKTSQNAYVYQLLAGADLTPEATGGMNFIPALNCYLPKAIDEIGLINENYVVTNSNPGGILNIPTKLNLITETGANVLVNGFPPAATTGPFPMSGTTNWVTYGIPNVSGNITVTSNKAITAGITAGSDAVGYGGFFAGFPTTPVILKSGGDCVPGIILTVDPQNYDTYQWYVNGTIIPGAINPSITPTQSGNYTCHVTMGTCAALITQPYKVLNCTKITNQTLNICLPQTTSQTIIPTFSSSTQTPLASTVAIVTPPTSGTASVNTATGVITYTPNAAIPTGTDSFTYKFCGNNPDFPDCEQVSVTVNWQSVYGVNTTLTVCPSQGNNGIFNLTQANVTGANTTQPVVITYYPTLLDAQNENAAALITTPTNYTASNGTIVYAVIKTGFGCKTIAQITLNLFTTAIVADFTGIFCDENFDNSISIILTDLNPQIVTNSINYTIRYYATLTDATAGNTATLPNNYTFTANITIYIRVDNNDGCAPIIKPVQLKFGDRIPLIRVTSNQVVCDDDFDGVKDINLLNFVTAYTADPQVSASFFATLSDAQNNVSPLSLPVSVTGTQQFFIRFSKNGICSQVASITITVKAPKKSDLLKDIEICTNTTVTLDAGPGFEAYLWSTGDTTPSITNVGPGLYWVDLTFNGCTYRQNVKVSVAGLPIISGIDINGSTVTIFVTGGVPPYEYSLDGIDWQSSNVFTNVLQGTHTVYVRDANKCEIVKKEFTIMNLINTITPNGDGYNEVIDYSALMSKEDLEFRIFDRYGAEVFRGDGKNRYIWDGNIRGKPVPTATYWYFLKWKEYGVETRVTYTSWLLVQHRSQDYYYIHGSDGK